MPWGSVKGATQYLWFDKVHGFIGLFIFLGREEEEKNMLNFSKYTIIYQLVEKMDTSYEFR